MDKEVFGNDVCKLLFVTYKGDFENVEFISAVRKMRAHFEEYVRNIYEEVEEIPLFLYIDYLDMYKSEGDIYTREFDELGITDKEEILKRIVEKCVNKYAF